MDTIPQKNNESIITGHYIDYSREKIRALEKKIKKSRNTLFYVAAFTLIAGFFQIAVNGFSDGREFKFTIFISLVFVGLALLTKKEPFMALVIALIIYVGLWFLMIYGSGLGYIFKGIIARAIIIYFIASGIPHAQEAEDLKKELKEFKE